MRWKCLWFLALVAACDGDPPHRIDIPEIPLDPESPWPKFRANALQNGRAEVDPIDSGADPWTFATGKGIFSTPVIDGGGYVYVGSADRTFYKISPSGEEVWSFETGEIIDSSALLDDDEKVYFGSGDGHVYALDRQTGDEIWSFEADDPSVNSAYIRWFEGNIAMAPGGVLVAPNDNFCTYAIARETGEKLWCFRTLDQTWSSPAVNALTGRAFLGNNFLLAGAQNVFAVDLDAGASLRGASTGATVAASPVLDTTDPDGSVFVGGFDGYLHAYAQSTMVEAWSFGARDHLYASPALTADGKLVQPSTDGTVYEVNADDGTLVWSFDALEPIRSSPAIDADGNIYFGSGEGRLFVLNHDGTLRWAIRLIDEDRNDLNSSPALGNDGVVIAGENGGVFFVPYDYCLRPGLANDRCTVGPGEDLPYDGAHLYFTTRFGALLTTAPEEIDANQALAFSLFVRDAGDTTLAVLDSDSVDVTVTPATDVQVNVSGDRKFITIVPDEPYRDEAGGTLSVRVRGNYLVELDREGLKLTGGDVGGSFDQTFTFDVRARPAQMLTLPYPAAPGDDSAVYELYRIAAPLPTILPSYNQIGFDSIHYLIGVVEGDESHAIAWGVGALPADLDGDGATVVDPSSSVRFALAVTHDNGLLTFFNNDGFNIDFNGFALPFELFRVATRVDANGNALESAAMNARAICGDVDFYGAFLQNLGYCNPTTDELVAFGGAEFRPHEGGVQTAPDGVGAPTFIATATGVTVSVSGSTLEADGHVFGVLLVNATTGAPVQANYVESTTVEARSDGALESVTLALEEGSVSGEVRAYLMVDTYPAAVETLSFD